MWWRAPSPAVPPPAPVAARGRHDSRPQAGAPRALLCDLLLLSISMPESSAMARTKVSSKYQIVIPKDIRSRANIKPGQEFQVVTKGGVITLVPDKRLSEMRGFLR